MSEPVEPAEAVEEAAAQELGPSGRPKPPGLVPLVESNARGTLATIGATCGAIGVVSLLLELLMARLVGQAPGQPVGLQVPFVSAPLGLGALEIGLMQLVRARALAAVPLGAAAVYWALFFYNAL